MKAATVPAVALVLVAALSAADVRFTSTFKSMNAGAVSFAGKKVAALVITQDDSLRVAGEEGLARELTARGMQGVATYRIAPKEELQAAERAKPWFEKANIDGVVALRPVGSEQRTTYTPGYYGYGWGSVYIPGTRENETFVTVESIIFSVPRNELLWAAVSETRNPKDLAGFIEELVKASVKEMQKQGLAKGQPK
jgi:hypothetical protein